MAGLAERDHPVPKLRVDVVALAAGARVGEVVVVADGEGLARLEHIAPDAGFAGLVGGTSLRDSISV